jgi:hypothetical protein
VLVVEYHFSVCSNSQHPDTNMQIVINYDHMAINFQDKGMGVYIANKYHVTSNSCHRLFHLIPCKSNEG